MLGWIRRRIRESELRLYFAPAIEIVREEVARQRKALAEVHSSHHELRQSTHLNHKRIADWIRHFDNAIRKLELDIAKLEKNIIGELSLVSSKSARMAVEGVEYHKRELQTLRDALKAEVEVLLSENRLKPGVNNADNVYNVRNITDTSFESLSNPEKWLVGVLFNAEAPLSYSQIAEKTGKSISTVRVYMNQLKLKGFIEDSSLPNGIKIFSLKHRAKVKKLYNL